MCSVNPKPASDWPTERHGSTVNPVRFLALGFVVTLYTSCASLGQNREVRASVDPVSPILQEGMIYTPVRGGSHGCVLYSVRIPGGRAPAALMYRNVDGKFSYHRPEQCVEHQKVH